VVESRDSLRMCFQILRASSSGVASSLRTLSVVLPALLFFRLAILALDDAEV